MNRWTAAIPAVVAIAAFVVLPGSSAGPVTPVHRDHGSEAATTRIPRGNGARSEVIGRSVRGRPLVIRRAGTPDASFRVLAVGSIHGDERQGVRVIRRVRRLVRNRPLGFLLTTARTVNPDGLKARTRRNGHGVDLNRNFPYRFDPGLTGGYESGPGPASEPETRAVMRLARRERFDLAIWYHQPWGVTLVPCDSTRRAAALYARLSGLRGDSGCNTYFPGSAIGWLHHAFRTSAFVVELPGRALRRGEVARHARAILRLARRLRPS